jgi:SAM-dependent methyltransferase
MAASGVASTGLDLSTAMADHARELARRQGTALSYVTADMRNFDLADRFDLAACMLCSATYLLTDHDFVRHLRSVAACLCADGLYVLELPHPRDLDGSSTTKDSWTVQSEAGSLDVVWRESADEIPPATRAIRSCQARLAFTPQVGPATVIEQHSFQRVFRRAELEQLVVASGVFSLDAVWGALDPTVQLDDAGAWRMVVVLRATDRRAAR